MARRLRPQSPTFVHSVGKRPGQFGRDSVVNVIATNRAYARRLAGGGRSHAAGC
ncbi:MAG: hypothetical protein WDM79_13275 [Terricaulis sp.]